MRRTCIGLILAASVFSARAQEASQASSALSLMPLAVVAVPSVALVGSAALTVVAVEVSAAGTVWVLERASDGARLSLQLAGSSVVAVGSVLVVTALSAGWLLSQAGRVLCFIPNQIGTALMHDERVTR